MNRVVLPAECATETVKDGAVAGKFITVPARLMGMGELPGLDVGKMKSYLALERRGLYWNRTKHGSGEFAELDQVQFLLVERGEGDYVLLLPLPGGEARAYLRGSGKTLDLKWDGQLAVTPAADLVLLLMAQGEDAIALAQAGVRMVRQKLGTFRLREEKQTADFADYLGWCTWDAFYGEVSAEKVLEGLASFARGTVQPGFVILDDGWLQQENEKMVDFPAHAEKFPQGLGGLIRTAKQKYAVKQFGVWHAFQGYWCGIKEEGPLGRRFRTMKNIGQIRPWENPPQDYEMNYIHPDDIFRFYQEFYNYLRQQGVDFVKVDGQNALEQWSQRMLGRMSTMRAYQWAYQGAIQTHFRGNGINCMCNGSDVAYNLLAAPVWRNSDDFFPKKPESHGRHIAWNALNSLWSANFVTPDWDMFWSGHSEGEFHAMARAISGGPVYVSDKPGDHDFAVLEKLVTSDGRVLRSDRPGLPAADRIFVDCQSAVALMKVTNRSGAIGVMGLFNCRDEAGVVADELMPGDIHDLEGSEFAVWLHKAQRLEKVKRRQKVAVELPQLKSEIAVVSPIMDRWIAPLGLIEKYNAPAAVRRCELTAEGVLVADIADGGVMGFWCASEPRVVAVSRKAKITYAEHLLRIEVKPGAEVRVRIVK